MSADIKATRFYKLGNPAAAYVYVHVGYAIPSSDVRNGYTNAYTYSGRKKIFVCTYVCVLSLFIFVAIQHPAYQWNDTLVPFSILPKRSPFKTGLENSQHFLFIRYIVPTYVCMIMNNNVFMPLTHFIFTCISLITLSTRNCFCLVALSSRYVIHNYTCTYTCTCNDRCNRVLLVIPECT